MDKHLSVATYARVANRRSACAWVLLLAPLAASAQQNADELAKKLSNPVAALISVPLQLNWDTNIGPEEEGDRFTLNIQPVIPVSLNDDWTLISRTILPVTDNNRGFLCSSAIISFALSSSPPASRSCRARASGRAR